MAKKRSKGITRLAVFYIIIGIIHLITFLKNTISYSTYQYVELLYPIMIFNAIGSTEIAIGIGLLKLKKWAQILGIGFSAGILFGLYLFWNEADKDPWTFFILWLVTPLFLSIFTIYFLTRPKVNEQFKKEAT